MSKIFRGHSPHKENLQSVLKKPEKQKDPQINGSDILHHEEEKARDPHLSPLQDFFPGISRFKNPDKNNAFHNRKEDHAKSPKPKVHLVKKSVFEENHDWNDKEKAKGTDRQGSASPVQFELILKEGHHRLRQCNRRTKSCNKKKEEPKRSKDLAASQLLENQRHRTETKIEGAVGRNGLGLQQAKEGDGHRNGDKTSQDHFREFVG